MSVPGERATDYEAVGVRRRFRVRDGSAQGWHHEWIDEYESDEDEPVGAAAAAAAADPPIPEPVMRPSAKRAPPPERAPPPPATTPDYVVGKIYVRDNKLGRRGDNEFDFHIVIGFTPSGGVRLVPLRKRVISTDFRTRPPAYRLMSVKPTDEQLVENAFIVRKSPNMKAKIGKPYKDSGRYLEFHSL
ncbi:MAG: hypothetical protein ACTSX8_02790 [Alphaproteobacteria bacterium]